MTWGEFHVPTEYLDRHPAVILLHGEDGLGTREAQWAAILNDMGVPTFGLDSLTGRGLSKPFDAANTLGQEAMVVDAYRALALLSTHPRIDPSRIALMGLSRGGAAASSGHASDLTLTHLTKPDTLAGRSPEARDSSQPA